MIQLAALSKSFGDRVLLDNVSWQIDDRERVGLSGPNGAGKTTLLKMLAGMEDPDSGTVVKPSGLVVGYLPQDGLTHSGRTLLDEAGLAFKPLLDMRAEIQSLEERLGDDSADEDEHAVMLTQYSELQENFRRLEGYSIDLKISTVLRGLGFSPEDFDKPSETFSGGWQMRIALAKLLLTRPGLLLLDEPTNHLDLEARNWLEEYLAEYPHAVILVSHDRFFLDAVVTRITEIGLRKLTDYTGNYSGYLVEREARMERLRQQKKDQDDEIERMQAFINRFRYQATKAAQVQSRIKMMEKIVPIEIPAERKRVHFTFPACAKSGRTVLDLRGVRKAYDGRVVFDSVNVHIERGDRIALIGPNGAGKSTMMRMLAGVEDPDSGARTEGHQVITQYFAQDEATRLDPTLTVYQTLAGDAPMHMVPHIRNILGGFLFSGDDVDKSVRVLSGGERTRLAVARMLLRPANTLLLDEPTNHLDLDSKDVLLEALEDFGGTLIFVSHDRYFVDKLATKVISIGGGDALLYPGNYEEFLWSQKNRGAVGVTATSAMGAKSAMGATSAMSAKGAMSAKSPEKTVAPLADSVGRGLQTPPPAPEPVAPSKDAPRLVRRDGSRQGPKPGETPIQSAAVVSYEERKKLESEARKAKKVLDARRKRIDDLETRIADREQAIRDLEATMAAPGFYDNRDEAKPIIDKHQALMWEVGDLMHQWEELQRTDL
ncbi:MAG TPA: ABC-F family ATP-binding cassette domain-containing protein [Vicinamibacterales bacterium]|nr:ABC-F family ATP-binding cassette domain-containing protein [Vicinamibacterales bacterium]